MAQNLEELYKFLSANKGKTLTDIDFFNNVTEVTPDNANQIFAKLESEGKISLDRTYIRPSITII